MIRVPVRLGLLAIPMLAACDLSAPTWDAEFFFPVDYPDVLLADYAIGGQIPDATLSFSAPAMQQDITGLLEEILSDDLTGLTLEIITQSDVELTTASLTITIEAVDGAGSPVTTSGGGAGATSAPITIQVNAAQSIDTVTVTDLDPVLLRNAVALVYETDGSLRGRPGGTPVGPDDRIRVDVNILARYRINP